MAENNPKPVEENAVDTNENIWDNIAIPAHPLHEKGNPGYIKYDPIVSVYTYPETYLDPATGKKKKTEVLFSKKYTWRKKNLGIESRLFPVWSVEKLYRSYYESLYKRGVNLYNHYAPLSENIASKDVEEFVIDALEAFLRVTESQQYNYINLVEEFESYCHYCLDDTYKDSREIGLGVIKMQYERLKSRFLDANAADPPPLQLKIGVNIKLTDGISQKELDELTLALEQETGALDHIKDSKDLAMNFEYLSLNGTAEKKKSEHLTKTYSLTAGEYRKKILQTVHVILSDLIYRVTGRLKTADDDGDIKELLKMIGQNWLNKNLAE